MIITCNKCNTKYNVDESAIPKLEFKARCAKCNHVFVVRKDIQPTNLHNRQNLSGTIENNIPDDTGCKVITICNQKGGVAKTTTCMNLGASLAKLNKRVLVIDFDIQSNLSLLLGHKDEKSFFDVIHSDGGDLSNHIVKTNYNFWLLPSNSKMALLSKKYLANENFEYMLREKLLPIKHMYDYILIDTPPSGDFYTLNALLASDMAIIPSQCEYLSMNGVNHIEGMINVIKEKAKHVIDFQILITMFDKDNTASNVILQKITEKYKNNIFKTIVYKDSSILESQIVQTPVTNYNENSIASQQYQSLSNEIINMLSETYENSKIKAYS